MIWRRTKGTRKRRREREAKERMVRWRSEEMVICTNFRTIQKPGNRAEEWLYR